MKAKLMSDKVGVRVGSALIIFFITFFSITILSYLILPEKFLLNKNSVLDFDTSPSLFISAIQIFMFNMISVLSIFIGSLFAQKNKKDNQYYSFGYLCFFVLISINAITLGTWSFTVNVGSVPSIFERIFQTFNIFKHAGLLEMIGQLLIASSLANKYLVMTNGKITTTKNFKQLKFLKAEKLLIIFGFLLMLIGAFIESNAIINLI